MGSLLNYRTPIKFAETFKAFYVDDNIKQIRALSLGIFIITILTKIGSVIFYDKSLTVKGHQELILLNYSEIVGSLFFFIFSLIVLKKSNWNIRSKQNLTLLFILFILLITLSTSYIISEYNTKNTITMFLLGVVTVSLFFVVEYKQIIIVAIILAIIFVLSMIIPKISFEDKFFNSFIGLVLGFFLISLSRYNYYYKSQNFTKIKELEEKNIEIENLNKEKNEILNFVAHDLRNPLNNIESLSYLLTATKQNCKEVQMIGESAKKAKEIINDLLDGVKSNPNYILNIKLELSNYLLQIKDKWESNSNRSLLFNHGSEKYFVNINPLKLERVLDNLISNSIKFSSPSQTVNIELTHTDNAASIKIIDYGIGIPKNLHSVLFDQFSKAGREGLLGEKSTGLGMHISKKIIEENNGQLLMTSEENKGTTFEIRLPLA